MGNEAQCIHSPSLIGERIKNAIVWELLSWDKKSLLDKAKLNIQEKQNQELTTISHWQVSDQPFPEKQGKSNIIVT